MEDRREVAVGMSKTNTSVRAISSILAPICGTPSRPELSSGVDIGVTPTRRLTRISVILTGEFEELNSAQKEDVKKMESAVSQRKITVDDLPQLKKHKLSMAACRKPQSSQSSKVRNPDSYYRCLDVEAFRQQIQSIRTRIHQNHIVKAYELYELADSVKRREARKQGGKAEEEVDAFQGASEIFDEEDEDSHDRSKPFRPKSMFEPGDKPKPKKDASVAARKIGLTRQEEFTGTEAQALKKLLRTLRTKSWDPQLYFHIRFFSIRNLMQIYDPKNKLLVKCRWLFILRLLKTMKAIETVMAERCLAKASECVTYCDIVESLIKPILWGPGGTLPFDKDAYKVHANTMLSLDALEIIRDKPPEERTPEDIELCVLSMQYMHSFGKLPSQIQTALTAEAFYIGVEKNRVILRQGHIAQNFYFVLSGQARCKRTLPNGKTETTAVLRKGDAFGSAAIFNKCPRMVTVLSMTPIHLLVVPKHCLLKNFIDLAKDPQQDSIHFLHRMWFMQSWPIERLEKCPARCCRKQFRRTEIMEFDAARSKWIYVVANAKGICRLFERIPISTHAASKSQDAKDMHRRLTLEEVPLLLGACRNLLEVPAPDFLTRSVSETSTSIRSKSVLAMESLRKISGMSHVSEDEDSILHKKLSTEQNVSPSSSVNTRTSKSQFSGSSRTAISSSSCDSKKSLVSFRTTRGGPFSGTDPYSTSDEDSDRSLQKKESQIERSAFVGTKPAWKRGSVDFKDPLTRDTQTRSRKISMYGSNMSQAAQRGSVDFQMPEPVDSQTGLSKISEKRRRSQVWVDEHRRRSQVSVDEDVLKALVDIEITTAPNSRSLSLEKGSPSLSLQKGSPSPSLDKDRYVRRRQSSFGRRSRSEVRRWSTALESDGSSCHTRFEGRDGRSQSKGRRPKHPELMPVKYKSRSLLASAADNPLQSVYSLTVSKQVDDPKSKGEKPKIGTKKFIKDWRALDLCAAVCGSGHSSSDVKSSVICNIPVLRNTNVPKPTTKYDYRLLATLRYLDVFGLEDMLLDSASPPPLRDIILISDNAECVMLSKSFWLGLASVSLRTKVKQRLQRTKEYFRQVTGHDCMLIGKVGVTPAPDCILDPMQHEYCIHC